MPCCNVTVAWLVMSFMFLMYTEGVYTKLQSMIKIEHQQRTRLQHMNKRNFHQAKEEVANGIVNIHSLQL